MVAEYENARKWQSTTVFLFVHRNFIPHTMHTSRTMILLTKYICVVHLVSLVTLSPFPGTHCVHILSSHPRVQRQHFMSVYFYVCLLECDTVFFHRGLLVVVAILPYFWCLSNTIPYTQCTKNAMHIWSFKIWTHTHKKERKNGQLLFIENTNEKKNERKKSL